MRLVLNAAEMMEVALNCLQNMPDPEKKPPELYCRDCKRIVTAEEASLFCYAAHDIIEGKDDLFTRSPK
jgi:hypothetical protein